MPKLSQRQNERGGKCDFWHTPKCIHFTKGHCDAGDECNFKHTQAAAKKAETKSQAEPKAEAKAKAEGKPKAEAKGKP